MNINGFELVQTCFACPEQYDVMVEGEQVAYLRLRHGWFYASCPDVGGKIVYETTECNGDGMFDDDEREHFLTLALHNVFNWLEDRKVLCANQ